jgi:hypothetical protein
MDQGLLFFDGRLYIPAASPLLTDLLQIVKREGPAGWELIALGCHSTPTLAHHNKTPTGILLGCLWPTGTIPSVTIIFIDDLGRQLFRFDNVSIALHHGSNRQRLSPGEFDPRHFMFGVMLDLTTSPPTQPNAMIWRRVPVYIMPNADNRTINNVILADPVQGSLHIKVEGILQGDNLPSDGVTTWTWFQREDALTRNGGGDVMRLMEGPGPHANGLGEAQTRALGSMRTRAHCSPCTVAPPPRCFLPSEGIRKQGIEIGIN